MLDLLIVKGSNRYCTEPQSYCFRQQVLGSVTGLQMYVTRAALGTVFVERLWRTVKYESIYLVDYASVPDLEMGLHAYFRFYNHERLHQSLDYRTPAEVHCI